MVCCELSYVFTFIPFLKFLRLLDLGNNPFQWWICLLSALRYLMVGDFCPLLQVHGEWMKVCSPLYCMSVQNLEGNQRSTALRPACWAMLLYGGFNFVQGVYRAGKHWHLVGVDEAAEGLLTGGEADLLLLGCYNSWKFLTGVALLECACILLSTHPGPALGE